MTLLPLLIFGLASDLSQSLQCPNLASFASRRSQTLDHRRKTSTRPKLKDGKSTLWQHYSKGWANMATDSSTLERKFRFMELPPEIRNNIDLYLLDTYDQQQWRYPQATAISKQLEKCTCHPDYREVIDPTTPWYGPYSIHTAYDNKRGRKCVVYERDMPLWHAKAVIWQLNHQIRNEARSLYITRFLSVDIKQYNGRIYSAAKRNSGVALFKRWRERTLETPLQNAITRLELRDLLPLHGPNQRTGGYRLIPLFRIEIRKSGEELTVRTPLKLSDNQVKAVQSCLNRTAGQVAKRNAAAFSGQDVFACADALAKERKSQWGYHFNTWYNERGDDVKHIQTQGCSCVTMMSSLEAAN